MQMQNFLFLRVWNVTLFFFCDRNENAIFFDESFLIPCSELSVLVYFVRNFLYYFKYKEKWIQCTVMCTSVEEGGEYFICNFCFVN